MPRPLSAAAVLSSVLFLSIALPATAHAAGGTDVAYGITAGGNRLVVFDPTNPAAAGQGTPITGFGTGEQAAATDTRPSNGALYVMTADASGAGRLYVVDPTSDVATRVGTATYTLGGTLAKAHFDIDFDPVDGTLHIVGTDDVNMTINPDSGAVISSDPQLAYVAGDPQSGVTAAIAGAAFTGTNGATATTLFDVDFKQNNLARQGDVGGAPNAATTGQLHTVGPLFSGTTLDLTSLLGFDISGTTGTAYLAALTGDTDTGITASATWLFSVNLSTGVATQIGAVGGSQNADILETFAVGPAATTPTPALPEFGMPALVVLGAAGAGLTTLVVRRRRRTATA